MNKIKTHYKKHLSDTLSVVSIYLKIRDLYPPCFLLESSDYRSKEGSMSYICFCPIAGFRVHNRSIIVENIDKTKQVFPINSPADVPAQLKKYLASFDIEKEDGGVPFSTGLFGYTGFHSIPYIEDIAFRKKQDNIQIPEMYYYFFKYVIAVDHYKNDIYIIENRTDNEESTLDKITHQIFHHPFQTYPFSVVGEEQSNMSDNDFLHIVDKAVGHCKKGDTFQMVPSRLFQVEYKGDEFEVYRRLRSINPSPYLFYFDYINFKIFGSSPEAQIQIKGNKASIFPIAGTFKRTGNDEADRKSAEALAVDPKENAEHIMLVDLARNDLSKHCGHVYVKTLKEIQFYSHVIHLVSHVVGTLNEDSHPLHVFFDTFPAGTLSGAPKYKAIELIDKYEPTVRNFYGGCIGMIDFDGNINKAITIRSFLGKKNQLYYQAGGGIVAKSNRVNELNEVKNKLRALRQAITLASNTY